MALALKPVSIFTCTAFNDGTAEILQWSGSVRLIQFRSCILTSDETTCITVSFVDTSHWHQRWIVWYIKMWYNDLFICTVMRLTCKLGKDGEYSVLGFELCVNLRHVNYWWLNMISKMNDLRVCSYQNRELTQLIRKSFLKNVTGREGDLQFCINLLRVLWVTGRVFCFYATGCQHPWAQPWAEHFCRDIGTMFFAVWT